MSKKKNKVKRTAEKPIEKKYDWSLIIAGIFMAACAVGIASLPGLTLVVIATFAGAAYLVSGVGDVLAYFKLRKNGNGSLWSLLYAAFGILIGLMMLLHPLVSASVIPWLVGAFFAAFGAFEVVAAFKMRKAGVSSWSWACASGVVNVMCGVMLFMVPVMLSAMLAVVVAVRGVGLIVFGFAAGKYE